ncbi:hypothetical protein NKI31_12570 [Mesorhizobium sp. M0659]|uniref:hypothetical protein n=1 Tax=Mesorhizobium sp. M0659 TaxID=2956980 RepID=UPI00333BF87F
MNTQEASDLIMREVNQAPGAVRSAGAGDDFCSIWTKAKPILELLAGIAILIPGVGATAGAVLKGLIVVGDKIAQEICH